MKTASSPDTVIFISFTSADREAANDLATSLRRLGLDPWWMDDDQPMGVDVMADALRRLFTSKIFIPVISQDYLDRIRSPDPPYLLTEVACARTLESQGKIIVAPFVAADADLEALPTFLVPWGQLRRLAAGPTRWPDVNGFAKGLRALVRPPINRPRVLAVTTATAAAVAIVTFTATPSPPETWIHERQGCATDYPTTVPGQVKEWALGKGVLDPQQHDSCDNRVELLADDSDSIKLLGLTLFHRRRLGFKYHSSSFECWGTAKPVDDQAKNTRKCWRLDCNREEYAQCSFTWCESSSNYPETMWGGHESVLRTYCTSGDPSRISSIYFGTQFDFHRLK